jgi:hypothetical protein
MCCKKYFRNYVELTHEEKFSSFFFWGETKAFILPANKKENLYLIRITDASNLFTYRLRYL